MSKTRNQHVLAPLGRRLAEVVEVRETGGYRVFSALDREGPEPEAGQFYMLAAARGWGGEDGRPYLARAFSVAAAEAGPRGVRLDFLVEAIGPGTERLAGLTPGDGLWLMGPLGRGFSPPGELAPSAHGAILVGGGIGIAPLAILRRRLAGAGIPAQTLLGFRDRQHSGGLELFDCSEIRLASEDDADSALVYACGPPAMLEAVREMCLDRGVVAELAMEAPMACGFGACFGCAIPLAEGGYMRLCCDGPVVRADEVSTALVAGSGH
jgi:NAD(P)H-flavin reductase